MTGWNLPPGVSANDEHINPSSLTNQEMVAAFMAKHGLGRRVPLAAADQRLTRARLITEEAAEAVIALHEANIVELADALADLLYVAYGTAAVYGIPLDEVFAEVHRSNMTKTVLDTHGKGGKDAAYQPPRIATLLPEDNGYVELLCRSCRTLYAVRHPFMPEIEYPICPSCRREK